MGKLKELIINTEDGDEKAQQLKEYYTLYDIALVKSYAYCEAYNPTNGRCEPKQGERYLKEGFIDGFMAGFTYKITGETE